MIDRTPIQNSFYGEYFDDESQNIYLLSEKRSEIIWKEYIDEKANTYFHLSDDNWLIKSVTRVIAQWFEDYNAGAYGRVTRSLTEAIAWNDEDAIWFCLNKSHVIECPWLDFKLGWATFLSCHDDAPIILNGSDRSAAFIFCHSDLVIVDGRSTK